MVVVEGWRLGVECVLCNGDVVWRMDGAVCGGCGVW